MRWDLPHWCEISKCGVPLGWCEICPLMWESARARIIWYLLRSMDNDILDDTAHNSNQHCGGTGSLENDPNFAALNRGVVCKQKTGSTWYPFTKMHRSFSKEGTPQHFCSTLYIYIWPNYNDVSRGHPKWRFCKGIPFQIHLIQV